MHTRTFKVAQQSCYEDFFTPNQRQGLILDPVRLLPFVSTLCVGIQLGCKFAVLA